MQREKEEALWARLEEKMEARLDDTLAFIKEHRHHSQMLKEARSLDSIEVVVCRVAACESACKGQWREDSRSPVCNLRRRLDHIGPEPTASASSACEPPPSE